MSKIFVFIVMFCFSCSISFASPSQSTIDSWITTCFQKNIYKNRSVFKQIELTNSTDKFTAKENRKPLSKADNENGITFRHRYKINYIYKNLGSDQWSDGDSYLDVVITNGTADISGRGHDLICYVQDVGNIKKNPRKFDDLIISEEEIIQSIKDKCETEAEEYAEKLPGREMRVNGITLSIKEIEYNKNIRYKHCISSNTPFLQRLKMERNGELIK